MPNAVKQTFSRIVGETLLDHTSDMIDDFKRTYPGQKPPVNKVPGALKPALRTVYNETQAGSVDYTHSKMVWHHAQAYMQPLVKIAGLHIDKCPEIELADRLANNWQEEGLQQASDSATHLLASYGLRIKDLVTARRQRQYDVRHNQAQVDAQEQWRRGVGQS